MPRSVPCSPRAFCPVYSRGGELLLEKTGLGTKFHVLGTKCLRLNPRAGAEPGWGGGGMLAPRRVPAFTIFGLPPGSVYIPCPPSRCHPNVSRLLLSFPSACRASVNIYVAPCERGGSAGAFGVSRGSCAGVTPTVLPALQGYRAACVCVSSKGWGLQLGAARCHGVPKGLQGARGSPRCFKVPGSPQGAAICGGDP